MNTTRSAQAAADGSWVTITSVGRRSSIVAQQREHVAPGARVQRAGRLVGEDHSGSPTRARAIATRCCWPPDSSPAVTHAVAEPDALERPRARRRAGSRLPASRAGNATFCSAVSAPSRLNDWKTNPIALAAQSGERLLPQLADLVLAEAHETAVGRSKPAANCSSVTCPNPRGP